MLAEYGTFSHWYTAGIQCCPRVPCTRQARQIPVTQVIFTGWTGYHDRALEYLRSSAESQYCEQVPWSQSCSTPSGITSQRISFSTVAVANSSPLLQAWLLQQTSHASKFLGSQTAIATFKSSRFSDTGRGCLLSRPYLTQQPRSIQPTVGYLWSTHQLEFLYWIKV